MDARSREAGQGRAAALALLRGAAPPAGRLLPSPAGPDAWIAFDEEIRRHGPDPLPEATAATFRTRLFAPLGRRLPEPPVEVLLCHPDGRVREAALGTPQPPPELVVIRCADWAAAVREPARRLLDRTLADAPAATLVALTPLVLRLARRDQGAWALALFEAALRTDPPLPAAPARRDPARRPARPADPPRTVLARLCDGADLPTRRYATRLTLDTPVLRDRLTVRDRARLAAAERDPANAAVWADATLKALAAARRDDGGDRGDGGERGDRADRGDDEAEAERDQAVDLLIGSPLPTVRAAGVTALRRAGRTAEGVSHLADRSPLVRACARWLTAQDGGDPHDHYRRLASDPSGCSPHAVAGLAESGRTEDVPLLQGLLDHPSGAVRAAAVAGLRRLGADPDRSALLALLDDPSPAAAREAGLSLRPVAEVLDTAHLLSRCTPKQPLHTRRAAFRLLLIQGGTAARQAAESLSSDWEPALRHAARTYAAFHATGERTKRRGWLRR
ncbi:HEAT repeat domain-containing protein [Streptomyces globosus]